MREVDLAIEGMSCASCVAHVQEALTALPGVEAEVDLDSASARVVVTAAGDAPQESDLLEAVESAGYTATVVRR